VTKKAMDRTVLLVDLRALRKQAKIGDREAAEIIGIGETTLKRVENGETPTLIIALKIAASYQLPVEDIWGVPEEADGEEPAATE
jgi:DNA-binding XRE family transcriptional regulator